MADPLNPQTSPQMMATLAPGVQWAQTNSPSLKKTRLGLSLIHYMIEITLVVLIVMFFGASFIDPTIGIIKGMTITISILGYLFVSITQIIGPLFCLAVPTESAANGFLVGSIVLQFFNIMKLILQVIVPMLLPPIVFHILGLCGFAGIIMFILFMNRLSEYINRVDLAARGRILLTGCFIFLGASLCMFALPMLAIVLIIAALILFLMYWYLVDDLRKALGKVDEPATA